MNYIGVDIGGTTIKIGFFTRELELIKKISYDTKDSNNNIAESICFEILKRCNQNEILGIGIGVPGFIKKNGVIVKLPNINIENYNIIDEVKKIINVDVVAANDASMAAIAEILKNNSINNKNCAMITLGTGVGAAIVLEDRLLYGNRGMAAEIGHILVDEKYNFKCGCSRQGCLETISSSLGLKNLYEYYKNDYPDSLLHNYKIEAKTIFDLSEQKDVLSSLLVDEFVKYLVKALIQVTIICDIDEFIIGGGIANAKHLLSKIEKQFKKKTIPLYHDIVFKKAVYGNDAGIIGAAYYIKKRNEVY